MSTSQTPPESPTSTPPGDDLVAGIPRRRIVVASMVGTTIEFYDFYAYATAAVAVFPTLFFPKNDDQTVALLASFATFGLAFVARPLGSVIFGHFGDKVGRKATLVASLLTMGIATFLIGLIPPYASIGIVAPAILALMRFCQGLGLGGEWSGAALLATETAEKGKRGWAAMWPQLGAPFGFVLANGLFLILVSVLHFTKGDTEGAFMTWGWRIPFLLSAVMIIIGLYVRLRLTETPVFRQAVEEGKKAQMPFTEAFRVAWRPMVLGTFVMLATYTLFYLVTTWVLSHGIAKTESGGMGFGYVDFLKMQLISIWFFVLGVPVSGYLADKVGRRLWLIVITIAIIVFGFTFSLFLTPGSSEVSVVVFLSIGMLLMGLTFGPMSAVLPEMFPTNVRYTGSGIAYNMASILGAAVAPFIATALVREFHSVSPVGWYLAVAGAITLVAVVIIAETRHTELHEV